MEDTFGLLRISKGYLESYCILTYRMVCHLKDRTHLLIYAINIVLPGYPEVQLSTGPWVQSLQKELSRLLLQNLLDQMGPADDHRLNGMDHCPVMTIMPGLFNETIEGTYKTYLL